MSAELAGKGELAVNPFGNCSNVRSLGSSGS